MVYAPARKNFAAREPLEKSGRSEAISDSELRAKITQGETIPEVAEIPEQSAEADQEPSFTIFFTGLPAAGKTTLACALAERLQEAGRRRPILFDGDEVRERFSAGLGYSREDRFENIRRVAQAAAEANQLHKSVICALVAPYEEARQQARALIEPHAPFILVHVATPLAVCEARDPKGWYRRARSGEVGHFTGISDPYEEPPAAELRIDTSQENLDPAVERIEAWLRDNKFL